MNFRTLFVATLLVLAGCAKQKSNGETIFRTGKNVKGEVVVFRLEAEVKQATGCEDCHSRWGGTVSRQHSIKYKDLANPKLRKIPYNDSLIKRFLSVKVKSDGSPVSSPAFTKMSDPDKEDLIAFLKTL